MTSKRRKGSASPVVREMEIGPMMRNPPEWLNPPVSHDGEGTEQVDEDGNWKSF